MATRDEIDLIVRLKNFTDKELKRIRSDVNKTGQSVENTSKKFAAAGNKFSQFGAAATASMAGVTSASLAFNSALLNIIRSMGSVGVVGGLTVATIGSLTRTTAIYDDTLGKLSIRLGVDVEKLSALQIATERGGTQMNVMARAVRNLSRNLLDARSGRGEAADAFEQIGFDVGRVGDKAREAIPAMVEIARLLESFEGTERTGLLGKIFGQLAGPEIAPTLFGITGGLQGAIDKVETLNLLVSDENAKAAARFNDNIADMRSMLLGIARDVGTAVMPKLNPLLERFLEIAGAMREVSKAADEIAREEGRPEPSAFRSLIFPGMTGAVPFIKDFGRRGLESFFNTQPSVHEIPSQEAATELAARPARSRTTSALRFEQTRARLAKQVLTTDQQRKQVFAEILKLVKDTEIAKEKALPRLTGDESPAEQARIERLQIESFNESVLARDRQKIAQIKIANSLFKSLTQPNLLSEVQLQEKLNRLRLEAKEQADRELRLHQDLPGGPGTRTADTSPIDPKLTQRIQETQKLLDLKKREKQIEIELIQFRTEAQEKNIPAEKLAEITSRISDLNRELQNIKSGKEFFDTLFDIDPLTGSGADDAALRVRQLAEAFNEAAIGKENLFDAEDRAGVAFFLAKLIEQKKEALALAASLTEAKIAQQDLIDAQRLQQLLSTQTRAKNARFFAQTFDVLGFDSTIKKQPKEFNPLEDVFKRITDTTEIQAQIVGNTASNMRRSFDDLFFNVVTARFDDLGDVVKAFGNSAVRSITDAAARAATASIFRTLFPGQPGVSPGNFSGGLAELFGFGGAGSSGGASVPQTAAQPVEFVTNPSPATVAAKRSAESRARFGQQLGQTFAALGGAAGVIGATQNSNAVGAGVQGAFSGAIATAAFTANPAIIAAVAAAASLVSVVGSIAGRTNRGPRAARALVIFRRMIAEINGFLSTSRVDELARLGTREEIIAEFTRKNDPNVPNRLLKEIVSIPTREGVLEAIGLLDGLTTNEQIRRVRGADLARILLAQFKRPKPEGNPGTKAVGTKVETVDAPGIAGVQAVFDIAGSLGIAVSSNASNSAFTAVVDRQLTARLRKCGVLDGNGSKRPTWDKNGTGAPHPFASGRPQFDFPGFGLVEALIDAFGGGAKGQKAIRDALQPIADRCEAIDEATKTALQTTPFKFVQDLPGGVTRTTELRGLGVGANSVQRGILAREFSDPGTDLSRFGLGVTGRTGLSDPRNIRILSEVRDFILEDQFIADWIKKVNKIKDNLDLPDVQPRPATVFTA